METVKKTTQTAVAKLSKSSRSLHEMIHERVMESLTHSTGELVVALVANTRVLEPQFRMLTGRISEGVLPAKKSPQIVIPTDGVVGCYTSQTVTGGNMMGGRCWQAKSMDITSTNKQALTFDVDEVHYLREGTFNARADKLHRVSLIIGNSACEEWVYWQKQVWCDLPIYADAMPLEAVDGFRYYADAELSFLFREDKQRV